MQGWCCEACVVSLVVERAGDVEVRGGGVGGCVVLCSRGAMVWNGWVCARGDVVGGYRVLFYLSVRCFDGCVVGMYVSCKLL